MKQLPYYGGQPPAGSRKPSRNAPVAKRSGWVSAKRELRSVSTDKRSLPKAVVPQVQKKKKKRKVVFSSCSSCFQIYIRTGETTGCNEIFYAVAALSARLLLACLRLPARPRTLAGRRIAQARFEPQPCRRASGFAWPAVKSPLQPCGLSPPAKPRMRPCGATRILAELAAEHRAQLMNYLRLTHMRMGFVNPFVYVRGRAPAHTHICKNMRNAALQAICCFLHKSLGAPVGWALGWPALQIQAKVAIIPPRLRHHMAAQWVLLRLLAGGSAQAPQGVL